MTKQETRTVAAIDVQEAPLGNVFLKTEPDQSVEEKYFVGWTSALTPPAYWGRCGGFSVTWEPLTGG